MALPVELVTKNRNGKPYLPRKPTYVRDILEWVPGLDRMGRKEEASPLARRIQNRLMSRQLFLSGSIFRKICQANSTISPDPWQEQLQTLAQMGEMKLDEYKPATARTNIQRKEDPIVSKLFPGELAKPIWNRVFDPVLMPKHRSFLWLLQNNVIPHGKMLVHFTETPSQCNRCEEVEEDLKHAFFECPVVRSFWEKVENTISASRDSPRLDFTSAACLKYLPHPNTAPSTVSIPLAGAFWSIYRARTKNWKEHIDISSDSMFLTWKNEIKDILLAKRRTAVKKRSLDLFRRKWSWLAKALEVNLSVFRW
jgi:hypothetical protein